MAQPGESSSDGWWHISFKAALGDGSLVGVQVDHPADIDASEAVDVVLKAAEAAGFTQGEVKRVEIVVTHGE